MEGKGVDGTEVTLDTAKLLLQEHVVEARVELAIATCGRGDILGVLTTTKQDVFGAGTFIAFYNLRYRFLYSDLIAAELTGALDLYVFMCFKSIASNNCAVVSFDAVTKSV